VKRIGKVQGIDALKCFALGRLPLRSSHHPGAADASPGSRSAPPRGKKES